MSRPVVAIVGRPNVGKSTLFNTLAGERISIVKDTPGVTRDRIYADVTWLNYNFTLIDTGGIEPDSGDVILSQMREQAEIAIATADVIMFITDVRQGLQDADAKVADMLRRSKKPVVLVVNKVDSFEKFMPDVYEFYNLGIGEPYPVSASSMLGLGDMLDEVVKYFPEGSENQPEDERPKVAIIGKPNVGKSSLINKLAQEDRVIVSDIAGTTRDAIDTDIKYNGKEYVFIDTAGLRRKNKIKEEIERYSIIRAVTAVERADVVIIVIDATEGVTEQDAKIAGIAHDRGKGIIIAVNKWDAIEKDNNTVKKHTEKIRQILSFMPYAEILFISAKSGQRLNKIFEMIDVVIENNSMRVATDVIVGFPGETEEEFAQTKEYLKRIHFYEMHIFKYSRRQGTRAAVMEHQVPEEIKTKRSAQLLALAESMSREFRAYYVGKEEEVLFEEPMEVDGETWYTGYTKEYVKIAAKTEEPLDNVMKRGRVEAALTDEIYRMKL